MLAGWVCLLLAGVALVWVVREGRTARRGLRPVRIGVLFPASLLLSASGVVALVSRVDLGAIAGMPRRYATYQPGPTFDWQVLLAATGVGLLAGAFIGAIRTSDGVVTAQLTAARTRNRFLAATGLVLLLVGLVAVALH